MLAEKLPNDEELQTLALEEKLCRTEVLEKRSSVLDLLESIPGYKLTLAEYLSILQSLAPRQYSISPSALACPVSSPACVSQLSGNSRHRPRCQLIAGLFYHL